MAEFVDGYKIDVSKALKSLGLAAVGWGTLRIAVIDSVKAFAVQEQAELKLQQALRITNQLTKANEEALKNLASQIQEATVFGDELVLQLEQQALAMGVTVDQMEDVILATLGLNRAFGVGLPEAMKAVVKASNGNTESLREYGIEIDKTKEALPQLVSRYAAFAESTGSLADRTTQAANAFGDLQEKVGKLFATVETNLGVFESFQKIIESLIAGMDVFFKLQNQLDHGDFFSKLFAGDLPDDVGLAGFFVRLSNVGEGTVRTFQVVGDTLINVATGAVAVIDELGAVSSKNLDNVIKKAKEAADVITLAPISLGGPGKKEADEKKEALSTSLFDSEFFANFEVRLLEDTEDQKNALKDETLALSIMRLDAEFDAVEA
ncbi:unnamed protein product, partial [marine sediment metagenome]